MITVLVEMSVIGSRHKGVLVGPRVLRLEGFRGEKKEERLWGEALSEPGLQNNNRQCLQN